MPYFCEHDIPYFCEHGMPDFVNTVCPSFMNTVCHFYEHGMPYFYDTRYALFPAAILSLISSSIQLSVFTIVLNYLNEFTCSNCSPVFM